MNDVTTGSAGIATAMKRGGLRSAEGGSACPGAAGTRQRAALPLAADGLSAGQQRCAGASGDADVHTRARTKLSRLYPQLS